MTNEFSDNQLFGKIAELIDIARRKVATTVNLSMVHTYYEIGRMIVEDEQQGKERAEYGKAILKDLSKRLTEKFGKGFSVDNLERMKKFYNIYSNKISATPLRKIENPNQALNTISSTQLMKLENAEKSFLFSFDTDSPNLQKDENESNANSATPLRKSKNSVKNIDLDSQVSSWKLQMPNFQISWSHYLILMKIENPNERSFYEIECAANNWSLTELKRQYHSSLYERLALSRNKEEVMKLATEGHSITKPEDILKNPLSLEFLGLEEKDSFSESDMEHAIIAKLQQFLLELGKGFLFETRQKRFSYDDKHFFVNLVFYNRLLQCYVLIDLKLMNLFIKI